MKAAEAGVRCARVQANLCRLECLPDQSFDYAISMFSTLGMIRGPSVPAAGAAEARRILRPGGRLRFTCTISGSTSAILKAGAGF